MFKYYCLLEYEMVQHMWLAIKDIVRPRKIAGELRFAGTSLEKLMA